MNLKIYLAGKISPTNDWREGVVKEYKKTWESGRYSNGWKPIENAIFGKFDYAGPFYIPGASNPHGTEESVDHCEDDLVIENCTEAIRNSDIMFAWIDAPDCYGTILEIGYAYARGKNVFIAGPTYYPDMWLAYKMAARGYPQIGPLTPKEYLHDSLLEDGYFWAAPENIFDSPIEKMFWYAWQERETYGPSQSRLVCQYWIDDKYRTDFAHVESRTIIELDGHEFHKTKEQRTHDAQRERYLEKEGWRVIRFTGSEVYKDAVKCVAEAAEIIGNGRTA